MCQGMLRFWPSLLSGLLFFKETRGFTSLNGECLSSSTEQVPHASLTGEEGKAKDKLVICGQLLDQSWISNEVSMETQKDRD